MPDLGNNPLSWILNIDETMKQYMEKRQELLDIEERMHFSYDIESQITVEDRQAEEVLKRLKHPFKNDLYNIVFLDYFKHSVSFSVDLSYSRKYWRKVTCIKCLTLCPREGSITYTPQQLLPLTFTSLLLTMTQFTSMKERDFSELLLYRMKQVNNL